MTDTTAPCCSLSLSIAAAERVVSDSITTMFKYNGDSVGSSLEKGEQYEIVNPPYRTVSMIMVENKLTGERIELSRKEWQVYNQLDLVSEVKA